MANEQNLIPIRTKEEARRKGRKGGLIGGKKKTPAKKYAAKLRWLKKKGEITDEDARWLVKCMEDSGCSIFDILSGLENCKDKMDVKDYYKLKLDIHKAHHGDKKKVEMSGTGNITFVINKPAGDLPDIDFEKKKIIDADFAVEKEENQEKINESKKSPEA